MLALGDAGAHQRHAHAGHDRAHVREVDVDLARNGDQVADALHRLAQHVVGDAEGLEEGSAALDEVEQPLVGDGDQGVDGIAQLLDAALGVLQAAPALEAEGLGDHRHGERAELGRQRGDHRHRSRSRAAAEARGQEDHVGALQGLEDLVGVLQRGLAADLGVGSSAQALGEHVADLQLDRCAALGERLQVGVGGDELDAAQLGVDHAVHRVAAAPPDADDLDAGRRRVHRRLDAESLFLPGLRTVLVFEENHVYPLWVELKSNFRADPRTFRAGCRPSRAC